jgi:hypothetical protein
MKPTVLTDLPAPALGGLLFVELLVLWAAQRRLAGAFIQAARWPILWMPLVAPGTVLHECAHAAMALVLRVRIHKFQPFRPERQPDGGYRFGYVRLASVDPLRNALVAIAPLFLVPGMLAAFNLWTFGSPFPHPREVLELSPGWLAAWVILVGLGSRAAFPSPGDQVGVIGGGLLLLALGGTGWLLLESGGEEQLTRSLAALAGLLLLPAAINLILLGIARLLQR